MQQNGYRWSKRALYAWFGIKNVPTIPGYDGVSIWKFTKNNKPCVTDDIPIIIDAIADSHGIIHCIRIYIIRV